MQRFITTIILTLPISCFAIIMPPEINIPHGIEIVATEQFHYPLSVIKTMKTENEQKKITGESPNSEYISYLLNLEKQEKLTLTNTKYIENQYDTHLKKNITQIHLNFKYKEIPEVEQKNIIGFAPMGKWENGWNGVVEYFKDKELGVCAYSFHTIVYVKITNNAITYDINTKPTVLTKEGNPKSGYLTRINWFTEKPNKEVLEQQLECANTINNLNTINKLILIAKHIDRLNT